VLRLLGQRKHFARRFTAIVLVVLVLVGVVGLAVLHSVLVIEFLAENLFASDVRLSVYSLVEVVAECVRPRRFQLLVGGELVYHLLLGQVNQFLFALELLDVESVVRLQLLDSGLLSRVSFDGNYVLACLVFERPVQHP